jgi:hypothetical protein
LGNTAVLSGIPPGTFQEYDGYGGGIALINSSLFKDLWITCLSQADILYAYNIQTRKLQEQAT